MKKIIFIILLVASGSYVQAQFNSARLQASGLTCAMCTKAINNALEELSFIQSVKADIKNSAFNIVFSPGASVDIDKMKNAVQEAGFSVAKLTLSGRFPSIPIKHDEHVQINGSTFHFLRVSEQTLAGEKEIVILDKDFLTAREFRKYREATKMDCWKTGRAAACCKKEGIAQETRIYHATI